MLKNKRGFWKDQTAIAWVWAMVIIGLILGAVVYFPLSFAWNAVYSDVMGQYTFTGDTSLGITVIQLIISYLMAFCAIFAVNWAIVNSKASAYDQ